jgi:hypothetical protein
MNDLELNDSSITYLVKMIHQIRNVNEDIFAIICP